MVADAPSLITLLLRIGDLVCLAVNAGLHNMVSADSTVVDMNVPGPEGDGRPFFHFESFFGLSFDHLSLQIFLFD